MRRTRMQLWLPKTMKTSAKLILHSRNPDGVELLTWQLTYWRAIHAEVMTHRAFSRNASSSRAIPVEKQLRAIVEDCAGPIHWGANQKGMQAAGQLEGEELETAKLQWRFAALDALTFAEDLSGIGLHKQIANRVLEPFSHITVLLSSTLPALRHFWALRAHPDAQPEFQLLAYRMLDVYLKSRPQEVAVGRWHVPFGDQISSESGVCYCGAEMEGHSLYDNHAPKDNPAPFSWSDTLKIATARCARVSYLTHDGRLDPVADLGLYDRLAASDPSHASAFEHCAQAQWIGPGKISNFDVGFRVDNEDGNGSGWLQYRKTLPREFRGDFDPRKAMARKPAWVNLDQDSDRPECLSDLSNRS